MTPQLLPNIATGNPGAVGQIQSTLGIPPIGNGGGSNMPGPTGMTSLASNPAGTPGMATGTLPGIPTTNPIMQQGIPVGGALPGVGAPTTTGGGTFLPGGGSPTQAIPTSQDTNSQKQLQDVFGKGIGGDIQDVIQNLGSGDSSYMKAYAAAMAPQNAENLATLNTTLGNSGVSANSSTAAIANADFQTGVSTQEGLQEQQLQQTDEQNLIGLLTSTEGAANKEASTSIWGDIGGVLGAVGSDVSTAVGGTDLSKLL
jgi:hypothetical protein